MVRTACFAALTLFLFTGCTERDYENDPSVSTNPSVSTSGTTETRTAAEPSYPTQASHGNSVDAAVCVLQSIGDSKARGLIQFTQTESGIHVSGQVSGLSDGKHGFHVHEFGDLTDTSNGESAGGHFNPTGAQHGKPSDDHRHAGDFGNIEANASGVAEVDFTDTKISLSGESSILGRALVVHADEDTFEQPSGEAGPRVAFGVIGVAKGTAEVQ